MPKEFKTNIVIARPVDFVDNSKCDDNETHTDVDVIRCTRYQKWLYSNSDLWLFS